MTGYGKAERNAGGRKITVEVRTLNSKQLDLSVRMPSVFRCMDAEIRSVASKSIQRGKADIYINVEAAEGLPTANINDKLFAAYYARLRRLGEENGVVWGGDALEGAVIQSILRLPDVVSGDVSDAGEEERLALVEALGDALGALDRFRMSEGGCLIADILDRIGRIERYRDEVTPFEAPRTENIKRRIRESMESLGITPDPNRLEQEMVFYVEKFDVTEEKVRLANHCKYFREVAECEGAPGRKLGFISQEIGREINTLGSKANDASIQRIVVAMKDELEKIKEQLLNIL